MNDQGNSSNLLDTTDCLEAVGVFKGWKNFLFVILLICILLLQACFWLVDLNIISVPPDAGMPMATEIRMPIQFTTSAEPNIEQEAEEPMQEIIQEPVEPNLLNDADMPFESSDTEEPNVIAESNQPIQLAAETTVSTSEEAEEEPAEKEFLFGMTFDHLVWVIRFVNAILILAAVLYCLTMIFSLKVSMLGRLGGINHITRAFFLSLLMLIFVLPWQKVFNCVAMGAIFTPDELIKWHAEKTSDMLDMVLYYLRFSGYMVLVLLLLILSQIRSGRWARAILRRLEII
jgi:hypothetical protein